MFKNVLIVEDNEMTSISLVKTIGDLGITQTQHTFYCDDALMMIQKSQARGRHFDLLITNLSFQDDHRKQRISGGAELISLAKHYQPKLKVLVFSSENRPAVVDGLFRKLGIDGYVRKARYDARELTVAVRAISAGKTYQTDNISQSAKNNVNFNFTSFDIIIFTLLSKGTFQKDIPLYLKSKGIRPSGLSSVEKRLNTIKEILGFAKNEQLIAHCKDHGLI